MIRTKIEVSIMKYIINAVGKYESGCSVTIFVNVFLEQFSADTFAKLWHCGYFWTIMVAPVCDLQIHFHLNFKVSFVLLSLNFVLSAAFQMTQGHSCFVSPLIVAGSNKAEAAKKSLNDPYINIGAIVFYVCFQNLGVWLTQHIYCQLSVSYYWEPQSVIWSPPSCYFE